MLFCDVEVKVPLEDMKAGCGVADGQVENIYCIMRTKTVEAFKMRGSMKVSTGREGVFMSGFRGWVGGGFTSLTCG